MAAYEACTDFINNDDITSFLCFMDLVIYSPEDAKELQKRGVLQNNLGSEQHVAELFNEVGSDLIPNPNEFEQVKHDIQKYFNNRTSTSSGAKAIPQMQKVPKIMRENEKNKNNYDPTLVSIGPYHYGNPKLELGQNLKTRLVQEFNMPTDEAFKSLMFLDGCFVVYFIHCIVNKSGKKDVNEMKNYHKAIITMDLFLLENQLPYIVLRALKVVDSLCSKPKNTTSKSEGSSSPLHLLDFLWTESLGSASPSPSDQSPQKSEVGSTEWKSFRSVEELKVAGINCMTNGYGLLFLPAIVIDDSFKTKWLNIAAYEACPDFINDGDITSFLCFMDSLIDGPQDVKVFRQKGVLQNLLGSDQHVADLFNELASELTPKPDEDRQVKHNIQRHFNKTRAVWLAEVLHTHFISPWAVLVLRAHKG
ncbi:UPF0481 protein At3g47200-like [Macadamia integrifolia]|uniref:UPF0481 protein At3g47200-like n=1 Tax=Macadamia integrifolia TaxID=60698 RepID=UPI001C4EC656|nr:UPF0481 protein At3g47200-like [Macadamia integrifolia]